MNEWNSYTARGVKITVGFINDLKWVVESTKTGHRLHLWREFVAKRDTLKECQELAEATAKLWKGE